MDFYCDVCKSFNKHEHVGLKNQLGFDLNEQNVKQKKARVLKFTKIIVPGTNFRFKNSMIGCSDGQGAQRLSEQE